MNGPVQNRTCRKWAEGSPSLEHLANGKILQEKKPKGIYWFSSVQFTSVAQSCPTLSDPMNCSTPGLPVHHQLPEFTQTHVH